MKFPKVSGKVIAAVLFILIAMMCFRRGEGYTFTSDQQKQIASIFLEFNVKREDQDYLKKAFDAADKDGNIPDAFFQRVKQIYGKHPGLTDRLMALMKPAPQGIQSMASKYNGFECMMKPPDGFECRAK
jgi:hypothetical protein